MPLRVAAVVAALVALALVPASASAVPPTTSSAAYTTKGEYLFVVPEGVWSVTVDAIGGHGGAAFGSAGGAGAKAHAVISVFPGETLYAEVGGNGADDVDGGGGGANGGASAPGSADVAGGGGGGASDVRTVNLSDPDTLASRLIVAGGGGGAGNSGTSGSGGAGGHAGVDPTRNGDDGGEPGPAVTGGKGGTQHAGGDGGTNCDASVATPGGFGTGGSPTPGPTDIRGGGGGGGWYGGGGGGSDNGSCGMAAAGGGGGSSYVAPGGSATFAVASAAPSVTITYTVPVISATTPSAFDTQPQSTVSAPKTVTVSNTGSAPLYVHGLDFTGANPGDFFVGSDTCRSPVAPNASCTINVRFAPQATGARSANLRIANNDPNGSRSPLLVPLSGTGGDLPAGAKGDKGDTGDTGAKGDKGDTGPRGPAGRDANVTCKVAHKTAKSKKKKKKTQTVQVKCTVRFSSAKILVKRATLTKKGKVYARGTSRKGKLHLKAVRKMRAGSYRLKIVTPAGKTVGSVVNVSVA